MGRQDEDDRRDDREQIADYWTDQVGYALQSGEISRQKGHPMTDKRTAGRPTKGDAVRSAMVSVRVEPWVVASLDNDRNDGESRADVLTRWATTTEEDKNGTDTDT